MSSLSSSFARDQMQKRSDDRPRCLWLLLALIVFASFAIRIAAFADWRPGTIESEGAEYARLAENLRNGVGYVGLVTPGRELLFNPLFPVLIAGTSFLTRNYELAGRLVALIMGSLLPLPIFGIAARLFNRRVGLVAALLIVLHPVLVHLSFSVLSEGPYIALLMSAVYLAVRAMDKASTKMWVLVGGAFGLAYLLRAEATAVFAIAVLFSLAAAKGSRTVRLKQAAFAVAAFLVLALPEVILIYQSTGRVLLEAKSKIFAYTGKRILAAEKNPGMDYESPGGQHEIPSPEPNVESGNPWEYKWAFYGIDLQLQGMGFPMRPHAEVVREMHAKLKDMLPLFKRGIEENAPNVVRQISSDWFGAPLLPALALLGAVRRPWWGPKAAKRLFVLLLGAAPVLATFFAFWGDARYYFVLIPLMSIWAANGLVEIGRWIAASSAAAGWNWLALPAVSQAVIPGLLGLGMVLGSVRPVRRLYDFSDSALPYQVDREVGLWIKNQQNHPVRIMDLSIPLAFHADAQFRYFPYCSGDLALGYLDAAEVDYVIERKDQKFTRYYEDWLLNGIPSRRAELLDLSSIPGAADKFKVYRWHRLPGTETARALQFSKEKVLSH